MVIRNEINWENKIHFEDLPCLSSGFFAELSVYDTVAVQQ